MMRAGVIGPYKDYLIAFITTPQERKTAKSFKELFPEAYDFMNLKDSSVTTQSEVITQLSMFGSVPDWVKDKHKGK